MTRQASLDWFRLSKVNQANPNLQQFAALIKTSTIGQQISKVPVSLKQKLLVAFQSASAVIKQQFIQETSAIEQLSFQKKVLHEKISVHKQQLQSSMQKLTTDKIVIQQKRKTATKLKQKMRKKTQEKTPSNRYPSQQGLQSYFCPFCTRSDFTSRDQITFHMYKEHATNVQDMKNPGASHTFIPSQLKQFVLSLKDKEIQLMEMMLNKKKEMETMEMEYLYAQEINKLRTMPNFNERKSEYLTAVGMDRNSPSAEQEGELKGQSQHLFYQPSQRSAPVHEVKNYHHQMQASFYQSENQSYPKINKPRQPQYQAPTVPTLHLHENYQPVKQAHASTKINDYYNIFPSQNAVSQTDHSFSPMKIDLAPVSSGKYYPQQPSSPFPASQLLDKTPKSQYVSNNLSWNQDTSNIVPLRPQPQSKIYSYTQNLDQKLEPHFKISEKKHETFYRPSKSNISMVVQGHIFNSGPLMDDEGDGSDYEEYFGDRRLEISKDSVLDEEIIVSKHTHRLPVSSQALSSERRQQISTIKPRNQQNVSMNSNSANMLLQYSKDKSALDISNSKEKSSDLIDLSNSFSKRALQSSKNNESSINLSDLKLSKLQKQKASNRSKIMPVQQQPQSQKIIQNISDVRPTYQNFTKPTASNPRILQQFRIEQPARVSQVLLAKMQKQAPTVAPTAQIKLPENVQLMKTRPGVLDQFFLREARE